MTIACVASFVLLLHNLTKNIVDIFVQIWLQLQELRCHLKRCRQLTLQVKQISTALTRSILIEGYTKAQFDFALVVYFCTHARLL